MPHVTSLRITRQTIRKWDREYIYALMIHIRLEERIEACEYCNHWPGFKNL